MWWGINNDKTEAECKHVLKYILQEQQLAVNYVAALKNKLLSDKPEKTGNRMERKQETPKKALEVGSTGLVWLASGCEYPGGPECGPASPLSLSSPSSQAEHLNSTALNTLGSSIGYLFRQ